MLETVLYGRGTLERLLGAPTFHFTDSGGGLETSMVWPCGCIATEFAAAERTRERFRLVRCGDHRLRSQEA
jgi:hypothetical protein